MLITIILSVLIIILLFIARLNSNAKYIANKFATSNTLTWGPSSGKGLAKSYQYTKKTILLY